MNQIRSVCVEQLAEMAERILRIRFQRIILQIIGSQRNQPLFCPELLIEVIETLAYTLIDGAHDFVQGTFHAAAEPVCNNRSLDSKQHKDKYGNKQYFRRPKASLPLTHRVPPSQSPGKTAAVFLRTSYCLILTQNRQEHNRCRRFFRLRSKKSCAMLLPYREGRKSDE